MDASSHTWFQSLLLNRQLRKAIRRNVRRYGPLVTGVLSFLIFRVLSSWSLAAILMVALLVHEYGHYVVARRLGIRVSGPYFIAVLGAFVKLDQDVTSRRDETYIALAGPFAGSIMTLAFAMGFALTQSPYLAVIAFIAGVINILQMVPMLPLDGGRALWGIVFSIHPYLGIALSIVIVLTPVALAVLGSPSIIFLIFVPLMIPRIVWEIKAVRRHKPLQVPMSKRDILLSSLACVAITVGLGVMLGYVVLNADSTSALNTLAHF